MDEYKRIVYVDMDGVLADWASGVTHITGIKDVGNDHKYDDIIWPKIDQYGKVKFFSELAWMPDGKLLWSFINDNFLNVKILSATGGKHGKMDEKSIEGKTNWLKHNTSTLSSDDIIFVSNKHRKQRYSRPNDIIIDDTPIVIEEWQSKGGIGILNISAIESIEELKKYV